MLTHLSLFSGIGGLDLSAEWAGIKTVGQCEWADYPTKVLEKHWPDVPRWKDIRTLTGENFYERTGLRTVDVISGGFPCQPFSVAGKQRGKEDDRYLWPEMVRVIKELRPTWVVGENVAGIVRMALPDILSELEACGYRTRAFLIPACAVGARHRRYRVAIVGHAEHGGLPSAVADTNSNGLCGQETGKPHYNKKWNSPAQEQAGNPEFHEAFTSGKDIQHANCAGCEEQHIAREPDKQGFPCGGCHEGNVCNSAGKGLQNGAGKPLGGQRAQEQEPERPGSNVPDTESRRKQRRIGSGEETRRPCSESGWPTEPRLGGMADGVPGWLDGYWDTEPDIPRIAKGIPHRADRIKALGNAVVPQQFYPIFRAIADIEMAVEGSI